MIGGWSVQWSTVFAIAVTVAVAIPHHTTHAYDMSQ